MHTSTTTAMLPGFVPPEQRPSVQAPVPYRMLFVGIAGVGKYSLHHQFIYACFPSIRDPFFDSESIDILWKSEDEKDLTYRIDPTRMDISRPGDSSGSEHLYPDFRIPADMFRFADNNGAILIYSVISRSSYEALERFVEARVREKRSGEVEPKVLCLIGNKLDCSRQSRKVLCIEGERLAEKLGCPFVECSAKDQKALDKVKIAILKSMNSQRQLQIRNEESAQREERKQSANNPSQASRLVRRLSEVGMLRSDTQRSSSSSDRDWPRESTTQASKDQNPVATRWKNAAFKGPTGTVTTISHSRARAANPLAQSFTTRIDEEPEEEEDEVEDKPKEVSRSSSQYSSDQSAGSGTTVTPPIGVASLERFVQYKPRLERTPSRTSGRLAKELTLNGISSRSHSVKCEHFSKDVETTGGAVFLAHRSTSAPTKITSERMHTNGVLPPTVGELADSAYQLVDRPSSSKSAMKSSEFQDEKDNSSSPELIEFFRQGPPVCGADDTSLPKSSPGFGKSDTNSISEQHRPKTSTVNTGPVNPVRRKPVQVQHVRLAQPVLPIPPAQWIQPSQRNQPPQSIHSSQSVPVLSKFLPVQSDQPVLPTEQIEQDRQNLSVKPIQEAVPRIPSLLSDQLSESALSAQRPGDFQELVERMLGGAFGDTTDLELERLRLEMERQKLKEQMNRLEQQQRELDEKRKAGMEAKLLEEKQKRTEERNRVQSWHKQERTQLQEKHHQEMEVLKERQNQELQGLHHPDDVEEGELPILEQEEARDEESNERVSSERVSTDEVQVPWPPVLMTEKGQQRQRQQMSEKGQRQEATKLRQQKAIDHLWEEERAPPPPPPRSVLHSKRRKGPETAQIQEVTPPLLRSPLHQTHLNEEDEQPELSESPVRSRSPDQVLRLSYESDHDRQDSWSTPKTSQESESVVQASRPEIKHSLRLPRSASHHRNLVIAPSKSGSTVATLGTLFAMKNIKNAPAVVKTPSKKTYRGDSWANSKTRVFSSREKFVG